MKYIGTLVIFVLTSAPVLAYEFKAATVATTWSLKKYAGTVHDWHFDFPADHQTRSYSFQNYNDAGGAYELEPPEYYFSPLTKNPTLLAPGGSWGRGFLEIKWICPYISRHLLSLNPLLACCRRYSRGER
ncbi:hypothetical protein [Escherichia coli]|uniref:hypothetical protein n=1 Tax=Escherichia coli TaxID=562 RepID=UPI0031331091